MLRQPPQTQPVSSATRSGRLMWPSVDQWPNAIVALAVARPGTSNQGMRPGAACSADSVLSKSMTPCAVQKRSRVKALTMTRRRSQPCRSGDQRSGWLPYMACKKSGNCLLRSTECTSPASAITSWLLHCRSEEHTSELQSHLNLVCRLLLEKKKTIQIGRDRIQYTA